MNQQLTVLLPREEWLKNTIFPGKVIETDILIRRCNIVEAFLDGIPAEWQKEYDQLGEELVKLKIQEGFKMIEKASKLYKEGISLIQEGYKEYLSRPWAEG